MKIIKESTGKHVVLRSNTYASTLDYFEMLFKEAKKTFRKLKKKDVKVVQYGGISYKRTFGIEFENPKGEEIPQGYSKIKQVEVTM